MYWRGWGFFLVLGKGLGFRSREGSGFVSGVFSSRIEVFVRVLGLRVEVRGIDSFGFIFLFFRVVVI